MEKYSGHFKKAYIRNLHLPLLLMGYIDPKNACLNEPMDSIAVFSSFFCVFFVKGGDGGPHSLGLRHWKFSPDAALCTAGLPPRDSATFWTWLDFSGGKHLW